MALAGSGVDSRSVGGGCEAIFFVIVLDVAVRRLCGLRLGLGKALCASNWEDEMPDTRAVVVLALGARQWSWLEFRAGHASFKPILRKAEGDPNK